MAMVIAKRGQSVIKVSMNAYNAIFKNKGYNIVGEQKTRKPNKTDNIIVDEPETNEPDIESIPISEMNKEQLMEYAEIHGIDTSSAKNVRDARRIIQEAVRESKM